MNQPWDGGFGPVPYCAVPVFPYTPGGKPTPAAVPLVTTARIIGRRLPRIAGLSARAALACGGAGLVTSCGGRQVPSSMAAATVAWLSGLTRSVPWPKASAARSTGWVGVVNCPSEAGMPRTGSALKPNAAAIAASAGPPRRCTASMAKVELQDTAKADSRLVVPSCSSLSLWKTLPPMFTWLGHWTVLDGRIPLLARAEAVTTLNV